MNIAELIISELKAQGVQCIYTLCGAGMDPLLEAGNLNGMRIVDTRNEQAASYMADAVGKLTRKLGVVAVSSGVAHLNALTGICNAWFDGSPMLLITGAAGTAYRGRGNFQDMETAPLAEPLCKASIRVERPEQLLFALREASGKALSGRPGPVHLTIPVDVLNADAPPMKGQAKAQNPAVITGGAADEEAIKNAVDLLGASSRPCIIAGSGVSYANGGAALAALAERANAPVFVPIWDRGVIESPIPQFCGVIGSASGQPKVLPEADLVLLIGAKVDYRVGYMEHPAIAENAKVIRIDADPVELYQGVNPDLVIPGNARFVMEQITRGLNDSKVDFDTAWLEEAQNRLKAFREKWKELPAGAASGHHVVEALRSRIMDDNTMVLADGGNIGQWFHMIMGDRYPSRWMTCGRSAVIGWGFPGAAAVRSVYPDRPVLLLSGDGSSTFTIAEIETASRQNLPYVAVIADDSAWGIVVSGSKSNNRPIVASTLGPVRFDKVAEGFGARGVYLEDVSRLAEVVEEGFASGKVTVIQVPIQTGGPADV